MEVLKKHRYYYCKSKIDPWSNLLQIANYPLNYRKQLFSRLLDIYELWGKQINAHFDQYYLAIWVFDNRFIDSQVVCAIDELAKGYKDMWPFHNSAKAFPLNLFNHEKDRISLFDWNSTADEDLVFESEYKNLKEEDYLTLQEYYEDRRYYKNLLKRNFPSRLIQTNEGDQRALVIKKGTMWVGQYVGPMRTDGENI